MTAELDLIHLTPAIDPIRSDWPTNAQRVEFAPDMMTLTSPRGHDEGTQGTVEVRYGTTTVTVAIGGMSVAEVKRSLRDQWNVPYFCEASLNGNTTELAVVLQPGDRLEFRRPFGFKAAEDCRYVEADLLISKSPELRAIISEEQSGEIAVRRAVQFFLESLGRPQLSDMLLVSEVLTRMVSAIERTTVSVERIADRIVPPPANIVDSPWIAERIGCTTTWIADMARRGEIPAGCIVKGTGNGKPWKFHRTAVEQWIATR